MVKRKEIVKVQENSCIFLTTVEKFHMGVENGDYLIKLCDKNKRDQEYMALYKPTSKEDLQLIEDYKKKNA